LYILSITRSFYTVSYKEHVVETRDECDIHSSHVSHNCKLFSGTLGLESNSV